MTDTMPDNATATIIAAIEVAPWSSAPVKITGAVERFRLRAPFTISRGTKTHAEVVTVTIEQGTRQGRGECVPYTRYGESVESTLDLISDFSARFASLGELAMLNNLATALPAGAARNAINCAIVDLAAKACGTTAADLLGLAPPAPVATFVTLSLDTPDAMAAAALAPDLANHRHLKLKLGGGADSSGDGGRMRAVRHARPDAILVADANEAWTEADLVPLLKIAAEQRFDVIEQPLPAGADLALANCNRVVPVCADESVHARGDILSLTDRYDAINIKLDKAGGLTEALAMADVAGRLGLKIMVGSMVATSLSMAPALLAAQVADWVDLDSPQLVGEDRAHAMPLIDGWLQPASSALWG